MNSSLGKVLNRKNNCIFGSENLPAMKHILLICLLATGSLFVQAQGGGNKKEKQKQENTDQEKYGDKLNLLLGFSYGSDIYGQSFPLSINYEFDIAKNFTLAPFISFYTFTRYYWWGNPHYMARDYYYRTTVIPIGIKGSYYFDELILANEKWDFYAAGSLGFAYRKTSWPDGYAGPNNVAYTTSGGYLDLHVGAEYHINEKIGMFLDLSTGVSSFGISIKTK